MIGIKVVNGVYYYEKSISMVCVSSIFTILLLLLMNGSFISIGSIQRESSYSSNFNKNSVSKREWTIMAYLCGDNNLEKYAIETINDMEMGYVENEYISIIVMIDRSDEYDESIGNWTGARYYQIRHDESHEIKSTLLLDLGEQDMAEHSVLRKFIGYCFANYSANKYMLAFFDHGGGISGAMEDNSRLFSIYEIKSAIHLSEDEYSTKIDIISFLACTMNTIEVAYEFQDVADYYIAEQNTGWGEGIDWDLLIKRILDNPFT